MVVELRVCVGCVGGVCVGVLVGGVDGLGQRDWIGGKGRSRHLSLIRPFPELREQSRQMTGLSFYLLIRSTSIIQMSSLPLYIGM